MSSHLVVFNLSIRSIHIHVYLFTEMFTKWSHTDLNAEYVSSCLNQLSGQVDIVVEIILGFGWV